MARVDTSDVDEDGGAGRRDPARPPDLVVAESERSVSSCSALTTIVSGGGDGALGKMAREKIRELEVRTIRDEEVKMLVSDEALGPCVPLGTKGIVPSSLLVEGTVL